MLVKKKQSTFFDKWRGYHFHFFSFL
uniref:Uncharacterized protein n=1 Tax=Rhizophora mucronata TaxID=61149 RepID=A0A2P2NKG7_RHIMU